jgi:uncharacterized linocin/CFP29 family protein
MNLLKRELAPITQEAWAQIEEQAARVLKSLLTVRKFADLRGPYGPDFGGVSLGRLEKVEAGKRGMPDFGIRKVQPLMELRVPFRLDIWELDNAARGAGDIDLSHLEEAARKLAAFEETVLYAGAPEAGIAPLTESSTQEKVEYDDNPETFLKAVAQGVTQLRSSAVEGPYALVVDSPIWTYLSSSVQGRPLRHHLEYILQGPVLMSTFTEKPYLVSMRGGDLELILGQDIAIGYQNREGQSVELFFTESFTYRLLDPSVVLFFAPK